MSPVSTGNQEVTQCSRRREPSHQVRSSPSQVAVSSHASHTSLVHRRAWWRWRGGRGWRARRRRWRRRAWRGERRGCNTKDAALSCSSRPVTCAPVLLSPPRQYPFPRHWSSYSLNGDYFITTLPLPLLAVPASPVSLPSTTAFSIAFLSSSRPCLLALGTLPQVGLFTSLPL